MTLSHEIAEILSGHAGPVVIGIGVAMAGSALLWLRRTFRALQYRRARVRNPAMSIEEHREHLWRVDGPGDGEALPLSERLGAVALDLAPVASGLAVLWIMARMDYAVDDDLVLFLAGIAFAGIAGLVALWRRMNDPPAQEIVEASSDRYTDVPVDAVHGVIAAGAILLVYALFFRFSL